MSAVLRPAEESGAERLSGLMLDNGWRVKHRIRHDDGITGASRSACYKGVSADGKTPVFIKAFDFRGEDLFGTTERLERMVREYNHERNVLYLCRENSLSRVTRILDAGKVLVGEEAVHYLICEWAEKCLREVQPPGDCSVPIEARLIALRNVFSAVAQLHGAGIAHQDIKPSNAVCLTPTVLKLTDLGSSSCSSLPSPPHDEDFLVGQPNYAPYELLYEEAPQSWHRRRIGCDLFLLGNLCFTSFFGVSLTELTLHALPTHLRHTEGDVHYSEVIPFLLEAHKEIIPAAFHALPSPFDIELANIVACLCHPDPARRGHSKNVLSGGNQFGLERVITKLDSLAIKARFV